MKSSGIKDIIPTCLSVALLISVGVESLRRVTPADAAPFHAKVKSAEPDLPMSFGDWEGEEVPIPRAAVVLLKPNVILHRNFTNKKLRQNAGFLLVQCQDARDLVGHYPPVCYKANGFVQTAANPRDWQVGELTIHGLEYEFSKTSGGHVEAMIVNNFMVLPEGEMVRDMTGVEKVAEDYRKQFYGAAQIQVVIGARTPIEERTRIVQEILTAHLEIIRAMSGGIPDSE